MSVLISNLNMIESIKLDIASAIEAKGVSMSGVSFPDYPSAIGSISAGGGGYTEVDITERNYNIINLNNSASYVGSYAFNALFNLLQVSLPVCSYLYVGAFCDCRSLSQVSLPLCGYIGESAFYHCTSLSQVSLPVCSYIETFAFRGCSNLSEIMIGKDISYVATLKPNVFLQTLIASGTGTIYVPASLISDYQAANNWSAFASQIVSIPE